MSSQSVRRINVVRGPRAQPTQEQLEARKRTRIERTLTSGFMDSVVNMIVENNETLEYVTETHVVTITVAEK